ncbi:emp24/gp25L/p24 family protein [Pelomyxa schiedti]|nr:emp24/gp25L/p24 family protein [Pelomyxa schiedti]
MGVRVHMGCRGYRNILVGIDVAVLVLFLCGFSQNVGAMFDANLVPGRTKCFIADLPELTLLHVRYCIVGPLSKSSVLDRGTDTLDKIGVRAWLVDPDGEHVLSVDDSVCESFRFTSEVAGEHQVCFATNTSRWFGAHVKLQVSIKTGAHAVDYSAFHISAIELSIRHANDVVEQMKAEVYYQRAKMDAFATGSDKTVKRMYIWALLQMLLLLGFSFWGLHSLKFFLRVKKLI